MSSRRRRCSAAFHYAPEAVANTLAIAEQCNVEFDFNTYHFPKIEHPEGMSLDELLAEDSFKGLEERFAAIRKKKPGFSAEDEQLYRDRLRLELDCIKQMGFPGYFLIVADFINWAKNEGIPVGPGQGFCCRVSRCLCDQDHRY